MAASSLLTLIDDIAGVLDDVAVLSKVATKKTAGVIGDDLALNAQQVAGVRADRELPVVWAVAKGSFKNKLILVPSALLISAFLPWAITVLLMLGGAYLCFEGFEKLVHKFLHDKEDLKQKHQDKISALSNPGVNMVQYEKDKIKGAIRTDFVLSAEIVVITLGTVQSAALSTQIAVLGLIAIAITVMVYGLVVGIVKLDDLGLHLIQNSEQNSMRKTLGRGLLRFAPYLMKTLAVVGTAAMFTVGGGILTHDIAYLHHLRETTVAAIGFDFVSPMVFDAFVGLLAGAVLVSLVEILKKIKGSPSANLV
ncbi:MAG: DUF808 domain-containing protein [Gammaproteobacteria bacterium]|nr:DUF808 domain-containing protein [Gammaproteobacteria bacterium]